MYKFALGTAAACLAVVTTAAAENNPAPTAKTLDGTWTVVCYEKGGVPQADARGMTVKAEAGTITCSGKDGKTAMTLRVAFGPNGTAQVTEAGGDTAAPAPAARAGVYVLTRDYLAVSVNQDGAGASPQPPAGQGGKARCSVILRREGAKTGAE
ncbi:MAG TPA: hypothetical protein VH092_36290 [Urbifossiella sp.]|jgi:hypothetical protein|nr:hypothetical protein [Urbifossiella sp.]